MSPATHHPHYLARQIVERAANMAGELFEREIDREARGRWLVSLTLCHDYVMALRLEDMLEAVSDPDGPYAGSVLHDITGINAYLDPGELRLRAHFCPRYAAGGL